MDKKRLILDLKDGEAPGVQEERVVLWEPALNIAVPRARWKGSEVPPGPYLLTKLGSAGWTDSNLAITFCLAS